MGLCGILLEPGLEWTRVAVFKLQSLEVELLGRQVHACWEVWIVRPRRREGDAAATTNFIERIVGVSGHLECRDLHLDRRQHHGEPHPALVAVCRCTGTRGQRIVVVGAGWTNGLVFQLGCTLLAVIPAYK